MLETANGKRLATEGTEVTESGNRQENITAVAFLGVLCELCGSFCDGDRLDSPPADIASVPGFRVGVAACGLKGKGASDVGVLLCESDICAGTAVFTRNEVAAAPVRLCRPRAEIVYRLGAKRARQGRFDDPRKLIPIYIRPPEAEERWEER